MSRKNRLHNTRGTLAMARTSMILIRPPPSSYINQRSNLHLDWAPGREGYAVFGEVRQGMDVSWTLSPLQPTGRVEAAWATFPNKAIRHRRSPAPAALMIALSVNLNKIALIRNSREGTTTPTSSLSHAQLCIDAGAEGITVHPRP